MVEIQIHLAAKSQMFAPLPTSPRSCGRPRFDSESVARPRGLEVAVAILRQFSKCATGMNGMERLSLKIGINTGQATARGILPINPASKLVGILVLFEYLKDPQT